MYLFWENFSVLVIGLGQIIVTIVPANIALYVAVFWLLERIRPVEPDQPLSAFLLNIRIGLLSLSMRLIYMLIFGAILAAAGRYFSLGLIDLRFSSSLLTQIAAGMLSLTIADFFAYWMHRCQHAVPFLWALHKIHHMDRHMSVATTSRHHWLEYVMLNIFIFVPMTVLFKLDPMPTGILGALMSWSIFFNHANLRLEMGWLTKVFGGPQLHRIHHSILPEHYDKNFTQMLPLWDLMFGTYYHPRPGEFPKTGIEGEDVSTALESAVAPWRQARIATVSEKA